MYAALIDTLHQCALADGWHKACITMGHSCLVVNVSRSVRVNGLINSAVKLQQVFEDLARAKVGFAVRPAIVVDHFFALINKSFAHTEEFLTRQTVVSVADMAGLVGNAR